MGPACGGMARRWRATSGWIALAVTGCLAGVASGETPEQIAERYAVQAREADPSLEGFSAEQGHAFYLEKHPLMGVGAVSCASCHRKDPREQVRAHRVDILCRACHVINDADHPDPKSAKKRFIEPFAPHANPERFRDYAHVEKFFHTNCMMMLKRDCTAREKGDLLTWLLTVEGDPVIAPPDPRRRVQEVQ